VKESTREFVHRHAKLLGGVFAFVAIVIVAIVTVVFALPRSYGNAATALVLLAFVAFFVWGYTPLLKPKAPGVAPTIREHMQRTRANFTRFVVITASAWCIALTFFKGSLTKSQAQWTGIVGGLAIFGLAALFIRNRLRCPRCGADFGRDRNAKVGRWSFDTRGAEELWDSCPHCGLSFDESWPG
jgi:uncharacterized C2H2 Zn-finger protein